MESPISGSLQSSSGGGGGGADYDELDSLPVARSFPSFLTLPPPPTSHHLLDPIVPYLGSSDLIDSAMWAPPLHGQFPQPQPAATHPSVSNAGSSSSLPQPDATPRDSKKRSRASRRAPTTVLTTDTSNFRAMVQEFTGIPAPPFVNSSFSPRPRLELFHSSLPSNLPRPFVQKPQNQGSSLPSIPSAPPSRFADPINNGSSSSSFPSTIKDPNPSNTSVNYWSVDEGVLQSVIAGVNFACESDQSESAVQPYPAEKKPVAEGSPAAIASGKGPGLDSWLLSAD